VREGEKGKKIFKATRACKRGGKSLIKAVAKDIKENGKGAQKQSVHGNDHKENLLRSK